MRIDRYLRSAWAAPTAALAPVANISKSTAVEPEICATSQRHKPHGGSNDVVHRRAEAVSRPTLPSNGAVVGSLSTRAQPDSLSLARTRLMTTMYSRHILADLATLAHAEANSGEVVLSSRPPEFRSMRQLHRKRPEFRPARWGTRTGGQVSKRLCAASRHVPGRRSSTSTKVDWRTVPGSWKTRLPPGSRATLLRMRWFT